jgi:hypothetical protein
MNLVLLAVTTHAISLFPSVFSLTTPMHPLDKMADENSSQHMTATQGSVYLITSDGKLLNLPIPSRSPKDPLNWSLLRRTLALTSMSLFTIVGLVQVQGTGMLLGLASLEQEYTPEVIQFFSKLVRSNLKHLLTTV